MSYFTGIDSPYVAKRQPVPWYLSEKPQAASGKQILQDSLSFMVLYNYIIPISLYVTIELQKFVGSFFLVWDIQLYDEETDQPAKCNSSDLNEELGQVSLFTFFNQSEASKYEMEASDWLKPLNLLLYYIDISLWEYC